MPHTASDTPIPHITHTSHKKIPNSPMTRIPHSNTSHCTDIMSGNLFGRTVCSQIVNSVARPMTDLLARVLVVCCFEFLAHAMRCLCTMRLCTNDVRMLVPCDSNHLNGFTSKRSHIFRRYQLCHTSINTETWVVKEMVVPVGVK